MNNMVFFLQGRGVYTLSHQIETQLKVYLKNRKHIVVFSEDIENAFDRVVSIFIIEKKLHLWGISKVMLKFIMSFLTNQ